VNSSVYFKPSLINSAFVGESQILSCDTLVANDRSIKKKIFFLRVQNVK
jgi:hypothetical protein